MKKLMIIVWAVAITALMGCGKDGETGPQGEQGPAGANGTNGVDGTNGTNGTNGNANVKLFMFGPTTFTSTDDNETYNYPSSVKTNMLDSSLVLYYHKTSSSSAWYATPGLGNGANYQTRAYTFSSTRNFIIEIADADGSAYSGASRTFTSIKAIVVPASTYTGSRNSGVNFNDYEATMKHFGLPLD